MDTGYRTPLLDFFKRGEVAADVRLLAAQGVLAPRAHEQLALLMLLVEDSDGQIAATADATIRSIPVASLSAFLARSDVPSNMVDFFGRRGIGPGEAPAEDASAPMISTGDDPDVDDEQDDERSATARLAAMSVPQRVARATKGTREERAILIRDPNKIVAAAVMSCPKLTDTEVESFARMSSVSQHTLRLISSSRQWMKNYGIVSALTRNAKTPVAVSLNLLPRLIDSDLKLLSTNRNVPDVVRIAARKKVVMAR